MIDPLDGPSAPDDELMNAVAARVAAGQCILFLGAGVHAPPPAGSEFSYPEADRPLMGGALSEEIARQCRFQEKFPRESPRNLQRVSFCYELQRGRGRADLIDLVERKVNADKRPSPVLRALAELDFPLVITTNYDQLFERALAAVSKNPQVVVYSKSSQDKTPDPWHWDARDPLLLKIHGDIRRPESIVITDEDYIDFILRMGDKEDYHPVPETFRFYFKRWPILFVGYSLMDYNFRLLFKTLRWKIDPAKFPKTFSVDPYPDPLIVQAWEKYVTFVVQDVWAFLPELYRRVRGKELPQ